MQSSFLLDTSAFKALPARLLEAISRSARLYVSPFCFWELLTHLDDDQQFCKVKGNLLKFRHVTVLDDPHAAAYRLVFQPSDSVHARERDGDLVYAALAALADSRSTQEFYERFIRDESGQTHQIAGCVSAVGEFLKIEENRFQTFLREIATAVRAGKVRLTEAADYDQGVQDLGRGWWLQIRDRANDATGAYEEFAQKTYIYHSYLLRRAREYADRAARDKDKINPKRNDFEDARLCLHLGLDDFTAVVTNDAALRRCLEATLGALNAMTDATRHTPLQVLGSTALGEDCSSFTAPA